MATDDNGIDPKATDGDPEKQQREADQLALARSRKKAADEAAAAQSDADAEKAMGGGDNRRGRALEDAPPDSEPEDEPELFPLGSIPGDPKVTHKNLVKAGVRVTIECALSRAAVPMAGGLHDFGDQGEALVRWEAGVVQYKPDFKERDAEGRRKAKGVRLVQELSVTHVQDAANMFTLEQVLDILEQKFAIPRTADKVREVFGLKADAA